MQFDSKILDLSLFERLKEAGLLIKTEVYNKKNEPAKWYDLTYNLTEEGKKHIYTRKGRSVNYYSNPHYGKVCFGQSVSHKI